jgi:hypothetical protein
MKGVPHFKKDGSLYKGKHTHKHGKGERLMTGKNHTGKSEYLFHINELSKKAQMKAFKAVKLLK